MNFTFKKKNIIIKVFFPGLTFYVLIQMPRIFKIPHQQRIIWVIMNLDTQKKKCDDCGLFLLISDFYKNKAKSDGRQNRCKDCMKDYKIKLKNESESRSVKIIARDFYFIPNIFLVGYGRTQTYQNCCLLCENPFFCMNYIKEHCDLFCDECQKKEFILPEKNKANVNFVGHVVGWLAKTESAEKKRIHRNYKKAYERDRYECQYCGYNLSNAKKYIPLHIDHIKPWSAQGGNSLNNLVVSCADCNLTASDKWFNSFEEKKQYILFEKKKKDFRRNRQCAEQEILIENNKNKNE
jgi:5-methylcytosine-specific restriction endonuclease McrA